MSNEDRKRDQFRAQIYKESAAYYEEQGEPDAAQRAQGRADAAVKKLAK